MSTLDETKQHDAGPIHVNQPHDEQPAPPYSVFSNFQKWLVVFIVALTTLLPPLTASIFYPVITLLADQLGVSITEINLTITIYLVSRIPASHMSDLSSLLLN